MPPAMYRQASLDGRKPGLYMVNLYRPEQQPRADVEAIAFHEAIPGHHLQIALAMERPAAHRITQIFGATAFIEGWGLYAERLADEMRLYSGDLDRLGMLSAATWRAARLVVDTGMHAKKWTREQAVDYMRRNTAIGENTIQIDCDVIQADGGTRTASITGAWIALAIACRRMLGQGMVRHFPVRKTVAAVSVGDVRGTPMLDLCYEEDSRADVDMNVVMTGDGHFVEVQGTAEGQTFDRGTLDVLTDLAWQGIRGLVEIQKDVAGV